MHFKLLAVAAIVYHASQFKLALALFRVICRNLFRTDRSCLARENVSIHLVA